MRAYVLALALKQAVVAWYAGRLGDAEYEDTLTALWREIKTSGIEFEREVLCLLRESRGVALAAPAAGR